MKNSELLAIINAKCDVLLKNRGMSDEKIKEVEETALKSIGGGGIKDPKKEGEDENGGD